jgi:hypothetical protein
MLLIVVFNTHNTNLTVFSMWYNNSPDIRTLQLKGHTSNQAIYRMCWDSKILLNWPPQELVLLIRQFIFYHVISRQVSLNDGENGSTRTICKLTHYHMMYTVHFYTSGNRTLARQHTLNHSFHNRKWMMSNHGIHSVSIDKVMIQILVILIFANLNLWSIH